MELEIIAALLSVCKLYALEDAPLTAEPCFLARTDEELSLVCPTRDVPGRTLAREDGWRGFRIRGTLDFALVGILARIASLLAGKGVSIFALSTYNTDYVLVREGEFERALAVLGENGYQFSK